MAKRLEKKTTATKPVVAKPTAAKGRKKEGEPEVELSPEQMAFAQITQGIHW